MGRKSKADSRKPEILEQTYNTLLEESLESASFAKIAQKAGIAPSLITHYFNSKEELIFDLTDYMTEKYDAFLMQDFQQISDPIKRLEAIISTRLREYTCTTVDDRVWYNVFALALRSPTVKNKIQDMYLRDQDALVQQLQSCSSRKIDLGELEVLARTITIAMEGLGYYVAMMGDEFSVEEETVRLEKLFLQKSRAVLGL